MYSDFNGFLYLLERFFPTESSGKRRERMRRAFARARGQSAGSATADPKNRQLIDESRIITVRAADARRVGLFERHIAHEAAGHAGGELFVAGSTPQRAACTAAVCAALERGQLIQVEDS